MHEVLPFKKISMLGQIIRIDRCLHSFILSSDFPLHQFPINHIKFLHTFILRVSIKDPKVFQLVLGEFLNLSQVLIFPEELPNRGHLLRLLLMAGYPFGCFEEASIERWRRHREGRKG